MQYILLWEEDWNHPGGSPEESCDMGLIWVYCALDQAENRRSTMDLYECAGAIELIGFQTRHGNDCAILRNEDSAQDPNIR